MSFLFVLNVVVTGAAIWYMFLNHAEIVESIKDSSDPKDILRKKTGLRLLWFLTVASVFSLPFTFMDDLESRKEVADLKAKSAEANKLAAEANVRAALIESNNLALRSNVAELEIQANKIDPLNQPVSSLVAKVLILVKSTNNLDFVPTNPEMFNTIRFGNSTNWIFPNDWFGVLGCTSAEHRLVHNLNKPGEWWTEWDLTFEIGRGDLFNSSKHFVHETADWDGAIVYAMFLQSRTDVVRGHITLLINGTIRKDFKIPEHVTKNVQEHLRDGPTKPATVLTFHFE